MAKDKSQFIRASSTASGTVIGFSTSRSNGSTVYHPMVKFTSANNQTVTTRSKLGSSPPGYRVGDTVEVAYLPDNPQEAQINSFFSLWFAEIILLVLGLFFFLGGGIPLFFMLIAKINHLRLKRSGERVLARFKTIEQNMSVSIDDEHPYRIVCQWCDPLQPSLAYSFKSENIWFNPQNFIPSDGIPVYIDPRDPQKHYYVDISFLPKRAELS